MLAVLDWDAVGCTAQLEQVPQWFEEWEASLSRFRADSELSQLNRSAGRAFQVSDVLWEVLQQAAWAVEWSGGLVTPTLLDALVGAGYDRSFAALGVGAGPRACPVDLPTKHFGKERGQARGPAPTPFVDIEWHTERRSVCLPDGVRLDLGGVAKGWAADEAVRRLSVYGPALVDAGGDIAVSGPMANGQKWPVGVADPAKPNRTLELLMLDGGAVATSGRDYRRWQVNGEWKHHIIDPRTGQPAQTDVLSVTVVAPTAGEAEVAAKVAFILGSRAGLDWLEAHPTAAGLLVLEDGRVLRSSRWQEYVWN